MAEYRKRVQFWAKLTFEREHTRQYLESHEDLSNAPYRPGFFYADDETQGYYIWPIAREGDEYGFFAMNEEIWNGTHRFKIKPGVQFNLGTIRSQVDVTGVVTRLLE